MDAKQFYREIGKDTIIADKIPSEEEIREFWNKILGNKKGYNVNVQWIKDLEQAHFEIKGQEWQNITTKALEGALIKTQIEISWDRQSPKFLARHFIECNMPQEQSYSMRL